MFFLILDKNPYEAVKLVPDRLKFKQLLELGQLICSAGISSSFKPVRQGKAIQNWIIVNPLYTLYYLDGLFGWCFNHVNLSDVTALKIGTILDDLWRYCQRNNYFGDTPQDAIFRYVKEYKPFTIYDSNDKLPIDIAINEYKKYLRWKEK